MAEQQLGMFEDVDGSDLLTHIDEASGLEHAWPKTLAELVDVIASHLRRTHHCEESIAKRQAIETTLVIANHFGGSPVYLPKGDKLRRAIRDTQIFHEATGDNISILAKKHGLTNVQIYTIISKQRRLYIDKIQPKLFD